MDQGYSADKGVLEAEVHLVVKMDTNSRTGCGLPPQTYQPGHGRASRLAAMSSIGRRLSRVGLHPRLSRERLSTFGSHEQQAVKLENTYRLEPTKRPRLGDVRRTVGQAMEDFLEEKTYSPHSASQWSKDLSHIVKSEVKLLGYTRYKIAVLVHIGSKTGGAPTVSFTSQAVWQPDFDRHTEVIYENKSLYAVAVVYVVYME